MKGITEETLVRYLIDLCILFLIFPEMVKPRQMYNVSKANRVGFINLLSAKERLPLCAATFFM